MPVTALHGMIMEGVPAGNGVGATLVSCALIIGVAVIWSGRVQGGACCYTQVVAQRGRPYT